MSLHMWYFLTTAAFRPAVENSNTRQHKMSNLAMAADKQWYYWGKNKSLLFDIRLKQGLLQPEDGQLLHLYSKLLKIAHIQNPVFCKKKKFHLQSSNSNFKSNISLKAASITLIGKANTLQSTCCLDWSEHYDWDWLKQRLRFFTSGLLPPQVS